MLPGFKHQFSSPDNLKIRLYIYHLLLLWELTHHLEILMLSIVASEGNYPKLKIEILLMETNRTQLCLSTHHRKGYKNEG